MIEFYKENFLEIMEWKDYQFTLFLNEYNKALMFYRKELFTNGKSYLYNEDYLQSVLTLFSTCKNSINNKKAFLIALVLNGLSSDTNNLFPSKNQNYFLDKFFNNLNHTDLFSPDIVKAVKYLCDNYKYASKEYFTTENDLNYFNDFRLVYTNIRLSDGVSSVLIYCLNPKKIKVSTKDKSSLDLQLFIDKMYDIRARIKNENLKLFYSYKITAFQNIINNTKQYD